MLPRCESDSRMFSVGGDGAGLGPGSYGLDVFGAGDAQGLGVANFSQEDFGGELLFLVECGVEAGGDGLLKYRQQSEGAA